MLKSQHLNEVSRSDWLKSFQANERRFVEVDFEDMVREQKYYHTRNSEIANMSFTVEMLTGVFPVIGKYVYLLCITCTRKDEESNPAEQIESENKK